MPVPGVSYDPYKPENPSVTAYIAFNKSLLKPNRSLKPEVQSTTYGNQRGALVLTKYSPTDLRHKSINTCRSSGRTYFAAVSSIDSGSSSHVRPTSSRILPNSACNARSAFQSDSAKKQNRKQARESLTKTTMKPISQRRCLPEKNYRNG